MTTDPAPVQTPAAEPKRAADRSHPLRGTASPTGAATATAKRATWREWLPPEVADPGPLVTIGEAVDRLRQHGLDVDAGDLHYWTVAGVLPRPVRQWHGGATRGLYPTAIVPAVRELRALQERGLTLDELRPKVRRRFVVEAIERAPLESEAGVEALLAAERRFGDLEAGLRMPDRVRDDLAEMARLREGVTNVPTRSIRVAITGTDGLQAVYILTPAPDGTWTVQ